MSWPLTALAQAAGARLLGPPAAAVAVQAVATDSRALPPGALFVALRGERFDGHAFVPTALAAGAAAVLLDERGAAALPGLGALRVPALVVPDTLRALGDMAHFVRRAVARPVAAVTGSNGKTTTKELLAAALGSRGSVHKTAGNLNNLIGLPQTIFAWPPAAWAAVLEMGMNAPGEIARLAAIAAPQVGLVTCVAAAHLGGPGLGSLGAIAAAKAELFAALPAGATAVLNVDDGPLMAAAAPHLAGRRCLRVGRGPDCDVQLLACRGHAEGVALQLRLGGETLAVALPLLGAHNAMNAALAAAAAWALGVAPADLPAGLAAARVPGGRLRLVRHVPPGIVVLDDAYNANPGSMLAAFAATRDVAAGGRMLAVLGDMLELGPTAAALHAEVGAAAAAAGIAQVYALGEHAGALARAAAAGGAAAHACPDLTALTDAVRAALRPGDVLLVKGSRGMRLERLLQALGVGPASHPTGAH